MTDDREAPADETPIARALRLKKAASAARQTPGTGKGAPRPTAGVTPGLSKPWMKL
jgi:hypothetical protein